MEKINLFLAGSPMEVISGLVCIAALKPANPVFFIDRSITLHQTAIDNIMACAQARFPELDFRFFTLQRDHLGLDDRGNWSIGSRRRWIRDLRVEVAKGVQEAFDLTLDQLARHVYAVHFTILHDYVKILLEACRTSPRILYPHGFDHPRLHQIRELPFLFEPRSCWTPLRSLRHMKPTAGAGELLISAGLRLLGRCGTCVPYEGTDAVYTFRDTALPVATRLRKLDNLLETFEWLISVPPWVGPLERARQTIPPHAVVLLISEYDRNPIWEQNPLWMEVLLELARRTLQRTGSECLVIKGHPRSDGTASALMQDACRQAMPSVAVHGVSHDLSPLPIEALALGLRFSAACSLGSCSLPSDIGIDVPHYTSPSLGALFDQGWIGTPFWAKYAQDTRMLIAEGICQDVDGPPSS
jgi:hypothetical protein